MVQLFYERDGRRVAECLALGVPALSTHERKFEGHDPMLRRRHIWSPLGVARIYALPIWAEREGFHICAICVEVLHGARSTHLSCAHGFCSTCIAQWVNGRLARSSTPNCPTCKTDLLSAELLTLSLYARTKDERGYSVKSTGLLQRRTIQFEAAAARGKKQYHDRKRNQRAERRG